MPVSRGLAYKALGCARLSGGLTESLSEFLIVFWRPAAVRARQGAPPHSSYVSTLEMSILVSNERCNKVILCNNRAWIVDVHRPLPRSRLAAGRLLLLLLVQPVKMAGIDVRPASNVGVDVSQPRSVC